MGKKYLDTKKGSLEQSVLGVWQTAIEEGETRVDGRTKQYKEHRKKLESARLRREKKKQVTEASGDKEAYQKFFNATLKKFGVKSPAELKDKDKKKFYDMIDAGWEGDNEKKEEVELDEGKLKDLVIKVQDLEAYAKKFGGIDKKDMMKVAAMLKKGDKSGALKYAKALDTDPRDYILDLMGEEVEVKEGKMSQLHQLMKDGKTAEEIAKIMRVDAKTIKKLMAGYNESYEIGTGGYRKHTENVTPGEDGEWVAAQKSKNDSMREALAKVWNATEDKNPFKKDLTKEVKNGKTMTGKKVASVDINPKIMEKKK
jgi:hypothetical protein